MKKFLRLKFYGNVSLRYKQKPQQYPTIQMFRPKFEGSIKSFTSNEKCKIARHKIFFSMECALKLYQNIDDYKMREFLTLKFYLIIVYLHAIEAEFTN